MRLRRVLWRLFCPQFSTNCVGNGLLNQVFQLDLEVFQAVLQAILVALCRWPSRA
jgi:hypothetical protein